MPAPQSAARVAFRRNDTPTTLPKIVCVTLAPWLAQATTLYMSLQLSLDHASLRAVKRGSLQLPSKRQMLNPRCFRVWQRVPHTRSIAISKLTNAFSLVCLRRFASSSWTPRVTWQRVRILSSAWTTHRRARATLRCNGGPSAAEGGRTPQPQRDHPIAGWCLVSLAVLVPSWHKLMPTAFVRGTRETCRFVNEPVESTQLGMAGASGPLRPERPGSRDSAFTS